MFILHKNKFCERYRNFFFEIKRMIKNYNKMTEKQNPKMGKKETIGDIIKKKIGIKSDKKVIHVKENKIDSLNDQFFKERFSHYQCINK